MQSTEKNEAASAIPIASESASIPAAAQRALKEAEARRVAEQQQRPLEIDGRGGPDPVRYGDWEVKGLASDF